jgi:hypothetical protein
MQKLHRTLGMYDLPDVDPDLDAKPTEETEKTFYDYRVYEVMQSMIEKSFELFYDQFKIVHSSVDSGPTGAQSIMARVQVSETDHVHICICRFGNNVSASAWKENKPRANPKDMSEDAIREHNSRVQKDIFFCSKA